MRLSVGVSHSVRLDRLKRACLPHLERVFPVVNGVRIERIPTANRAQLPAQFSGRFATDIRAKTGAPPYRIWRPFCHCYPHSSGGASLPHLEAVLPLITPPWCAQIPTEIRGQMSGELRVRFPCRFPQEERARWRLPTASRLKTTRFAAEMGADETNVLIIIILA